MSAGHHHGHSHGHGDASAGNLRKLAVVLALSFGYMPEPSQVKDLETGSLYIFAGSAVSLGAAAWSALRGDPFWVTG